MSSAANRASRVRALPSLVARLVDATAPALDNFFVRLEVYTAEHGHSRPSVRHRLHAWCERQRQAHRRGMLLPDRAVALRSLPGWTWDLAEQQWTEQWAHVVTAAGKQLLLHDPAVMNQAILHPSSRSGVTTIGRWCVQQRILARRGDLDPMRRGRLEEIPGWTWSALSVQDTVCLDLLGEYVAWKHDANVPADYVDDEQPVGAWLDTVRRRRALGTLDQVLVDELEVVTPARSSAGALRWERGETQWSLGLEALPQFVARKGRGGVPGQHLERLPEATVPLSVWCRRQRHDHRYGNLRVDRVAALEAVDGWLWEIQPTPRISIDIGDARHGTRTGYVKGCRCLQCTDANRAEQHARDGLVRAGGPSTDLVPAGLVRGHLRILEGQGATQKSLARASDLNVKTVVEILDGSRARILPETEKTELSLRIEHV